MVKGETTSPSLNSLPVMQSTGDRVIEQIREAILGGRFRPGDRLSADGLARELQVSHIPIREALNKLQVEGHLIAVPKRGFFVPELSLREVEDVYHWRRVLEDEAHQMALPKLTADDGKQLVKLCTLMRQATRARDASRFHQINRRFHFLIFERAGSVRLVRMLENLWDSASHYQCVLISGDTSIPLLQEDHEVLLDAYRAGDAQRAIAIMGGHRTTTLSLMREILQREEDDRDVSVDGDRP
jgi:DNA-binding GntR family transcriptional regulator